MREQGATKPLSAISQSEVTNGGAAKGASEAASAKLRKQEGSQREQLARLFKAKASERETKLTKLQLRRWSKHCKNNRTGNFVTARCLPRS